MTVWDVKMPTQVNSVPMTCLGKDGKQYLIVSRGGIIDCTLP